MVMVLEGLVRDCMAKANNETVGDQANYEHEAVGDLAN